MLGDVNKLFVFKSLLATPGNVLPLHLKQTFLPIIWFFTEDEGDEIKSRLPFKIFSTLASIQQSVFKILGLTHYFRVVLALSTLGNVQTNNTYFDWKFYFSDTWRLWIGNRNIGRFCLPNCQTKYKKQCNVHIGVWFKRFKP